MARLVGYAAALAALALAPAGQAGQTISKNMVECAALMDVASLHVSDPERLAELNRAATVWALSAAEQAKREGGLAGDLSLAFTARKRAWLEAGAGFAFSQEFRDWASYCRALAMRYDVDVGLSQPKD